MLPSQTIRSTSARSTMYRRGRGRQWLAIAGVVTLVVAAILGIPWLAGRGEPSKADAGTSSSAASPKGPDVLAKNQADSVKPIQKKDNAPAGTPSDSLKASHTQQPRVSMGGPAAAAPPADNKPTAAQAPKSEIARPRAPAGVSEAKPDEPSVRSGPADSPVKTAAAPPDSDKASPLVPASEPVNATPSNSSALQRIDLGMQLVKQNKPLEARRMLTEALLSSGISASDAQRVRQELTTLNQRLIFSPEVVASDPFVSVHQIQSGESLAKLPRKLGLAVDWRFLQRINKINDPARLQLNQRVKVVKGPFHAVVDKRAFRLDLYMGDGSDRVFVASYPVGLGEYGATPEGEFIVKTNSKLEDPAWTNPRTGEHFASKDPKNPLGKYWIGLVGISDNIRGLEGYGLHGTIEPDSIGQERSMGCVRMHADDIKLMFEVLIDNVSHVEIHGPDWP